MNGQEEFYIGWEDKAPPCTNRRMRRATVLLLVMAAGLAVLLAGAQRSIGASVFEWGKVKSFTGILNSRPYPHLLVPRPGARGGQTEFSSYCLVSPFKFGFDMAKAGRLDGKRVSLKGTLIYRDDQTMIEVVENSVAEMDTTASEWPAAPGSVHLGRHTLLGEIVDSKCYFGVMNPGAFIPHRACAIRCIRGGIPPVFLVRQTNGPALCFLLVSSQGKPVNREVLDFVAEPLLITGEIERQGDLLILRADPGSYRRASL